MIKNYFIHIIGCMCFCLAIIGVKHSTVIAQETEAVTKPCFAKSCYDINYDCRPKYCFVSGLLICFDAKGNRILPTGLKLVGKATITKNSYSAKFDSSGDGKADYGCTLKFSKDECGLKHPCAKATGKISFYDKGKKYADCKAIAYYAGAPSSVELENSNDSGRLRSPLD